MVLWNVRRKIKYAVAVAGLIVVIAITIFIAALIHQNLNTNTKILLNNQYNELFTEDELIQKGHIKTLTGYSSDSSIAFLNDDGSTTLYVYASPIRYLDQKGNFALIDTRLTNITDNDMLEDDYFYTVVSNDIIPFYPKYLSAQKGIKLINKTEAW